MCRDEINFTGIIFNGCGPLPFNGFIISRYIPSIKKQLAKRGLSINERINIVGNILK